MSLAIGRACGDRTRGEAAKAWATDGLRAVMVEQEQKPPRGNPKARSVAIPAVAAQHVAKTAGARDLVVVGIGGKSVALCVFTSAIVWEPTAQVLRTGRRVW